MVKEQSSGSLSLETKLSNMLQDVQPPESHGLQMECIYRVPQALRETNPKAYTPQAVSIGPFHKPRDVGIGDNILVSMEKLKLKYFKGFLNRTRLPIDNFVGELRRLEEEIRSCYEGHIINYDSDDFLEMILIDASFIVEHFLRWHAYGDWRRKDPLLRKQLLLHQIKKDLILLENQLPFFVLELLYNHAVMNPNLPSFLDISFKYFKSIYGTACPTESPKHFTDFLRTCLIAASKFHLKEQEGYKSITHVYTASQLLEAGLKFKISPNGSIFDLTYSDPGVLTMPVLTIDDDTELVFRNILAFEHSHLPCTDFINQYITILDFLINTEKDVSVLVDKKIIDNWMGDANAVATMVNSLGSNALLPCFNSEYFSICNSLNNFYENPRNKYKAIFIHEYFNTPWKIASTIAATVLLLLTLIQTICSIIQLV